MVVVLDVETSIHNKGNPYDQRNQLVCWSYCTESGAGAARWPDVEYCQSIVDSADVVVGFNIKFDLHWLMNNGVVFDDVKIWDVQIAEFIISHQTNKLPSLDATCEKYGIPTKPNAVKEYWDKGISTENIPWHILQEYAIHDVEATLQCYYRQLFHMTYEQQRLCRLMCMDLMVLAEMEQTGLAFDEQLCNERAAQLDARIQEIQKQLGQYYPHVPINFGSGDHLSAFLYGGIVPEDSKEHIGFYKTGEKAGQPKYKNVVIEHPLPRLYTPLKGSELKKEGMYATDEATLRKLKGKHKVVPLLLELSKLQKLNGTYYRGLVNLRETMHWPVGKLHGQFNQTIAATGRLSSTKPNVQNFATELQDIFITTY